MAKSKIDRFLDTVYGAAEAKAGKMIREIDRAGESALREYRAELRRSADAQRRRESAKAAKQGAETAAHDETEIRRELLAKRSAVTDKVFTEVRHRLEEYRKTPGYRDALLKDAAAVAEIIGKADGAVLLIGTADEDFAAELSAAAGIPVRTDGSIVIGGLRGVSDTVECDCTLDARLESAKSDFARQSGLSVV